MLGLKDKEPEQDWLTDDYVAYLLKLVARRLGGVATVTPSEYRVEREKLLKADRASWLHGAQRLVPNDEQIRTACGSWDNALLLAGLRKRPKPGLTRSESVVPAYVQLIEDCYQRHDALSTLAELETFARANNLPCPKRGVKTWSVSVQAWKTGREDDGLFVPDGPPPKSQRPDYSRNVGAARPGEQRLVRWSMADCVAWVTRYLKQLPAGQHSTKRGYDDWARSQAGAPHASAFDRHGGWNAVRKAALANLAPAAPRRTVH